MISPEKAADLRVKQLEMLQGLINRMAGYGASFKSYCITVVTAVIGFAFTLHSPLVVGLAILPIIFFALADAQYLTVERRFRDVFDIVRKAGWDEMPSFDLNPQNAPPQSLLAALRSWSIGYFYAPLALVVLVVAVGAWVYGR